jgi:hypothetical protein
MAPTLDPASAEKPPQPPPIERRTRLGRVQKIGMPLLALIPVAALLGVFGPGEATSRAAAGELSIEVRYPSLLRHKTSQPFELTVTNRGATPALGVAARIDEAWLSSFGAVEVRPQPQRLDARHAEFALGDLAPGAVRKVSGRLEAGDPGRHTGAASLSVGEREVAQAALATRVLP